MKFQLGILTSRFRANHPLKACIQCIHEDTIKIGLPYWHLSHQYPGIWTCNRHGELLYESTTKSTGVGRFLWYLPERKNLALHKSLLDVSRQDQLAIQLHRLTTMITNYIDSTKKIFFASDVLINTYKSTLTTLGYSNRSGKLNFKRIAADFRESLSPVINSGIFSGLPSDQASAESQIYRLLRTPRTGTHPLRHLLFIFWLFPDWITFWERYKNQETRSNSQQEKCIPKDYLFEDEPIDPRKCRFIALIKEDQLSITKASKIIGIDTSTGLAWATKFGIGFKRRSKALKGEVRLLLIDDLKLGLDKDLLAQKYNISVQLITTTLRTELALHDVWCTARFNKRKTMEREKFEILVSEIGLLGSKAIRQAAPATYAWLYRNDRDWLNQTLASIPKVAVHNNSKVNWQERDLALSSQIAKVALELSQNGARVIKLWELYQLVPNLKSKLGALDRLPLTNRILRLTLNRGTKEKSEVSNLKFD